MSSIYMFVIGGTIKGAAYYSRIGGRDNKRGGALLV